VIQAGLYLRMSRDAEARGLGIGRQRKDGEALATRLGWPIVQEYSDQDLSASKYSRKPRPGYRRMLQDLQEGAVNAVVVYDQDRLVRQPKELEELLEVCDRARAWHIAAVSGEIDVRNSDDLFRARILAAVNAKESDNISRRVRRKQRELAEQGRPHGGPRRYGYRRDFSAIEPAEAAIVQELARRTLAGESLSSLCLDLNARGVATAAAGRWAPATLRRVLIGPHLAGLRVYGEHLFPAAWPPILSEDTHQALRALLTDPHRKTNPMHPTRHLWSGLLVCGHCGMRMYAYYRQAKSGPVKTLRCHRRLGGCGRLARGAEPIEAFLEAAVFEMVQRPAFAQFLSRRTTALDQRGALLEQIRAVEALQQENLVAYAAPEPGERRRSKADYELVAARLDRQLGLLNHKLRALRAPELPEALAGGDLEAEWAALPFYARRRIVDTLIARVTVLPVGRGCRKFDPSSVRIDWTFQ
jgi:DNA invertase Pin-like site-specific DNA recombinase